MSPELQKHAHLLVVDDDPEMLAFFKEQLSLRGYAIDTASNGSEAVSMCSRTTFDIVLCDLKMPLMDGITCLENIKSINPSGPVIMISGEGSIDEAVGALKKGAYDFLQKPVVMEDLLFRIEKALEKKNLDAMLALYESGHTVLSEMRLDKLLESILDILCGTLRADEGSFMLVGPEHHLHIAASRGLSDEVVFSTILRLGERVAGLAARDNKPFLLVSGLAHYEQFEDIEPRPRIRSSIIVPVYHAESLVGVLNLNRILLEENFTVEDLKSVMAFASQIANAVEGARLSRRLEEKMAELRNIYTALESSKSLLAQKEKLAALGTLVSQAAHELNTPLTSVMGYAELVLHTRDLRAEDKARIEIVLGEAKRCREMVHNLLVYGNQRKPDLSPSNPAQLLDETLKLLALEIEKDGIAVSVQDSAEGACVAADRGQLKQVFINLIKNALQAMRDKAKRCLSVRFRRLDGKLHMEFEDTGGGISDGLIKTLFQPFVTTKSPGEGTGLGLCLSREIIRHHGGRLFVSNTPQGALFKIELPVLAA